MPEDFDFSALPGSSDESCDVEHDLLAQLQQCETELEKVIWKLVQFYTSTNQPLAAFRFVDRLLNTTDNLEKKAFFYLTMGQTVEQSGDFQAAVSFYVRAFSLEPVNHQVWFLINNNLGNCLNRLEKYAESEGYCRAAIQMDGTHHSSYQNMGIALQGQKRFAQAAQYFIKAVHSNPGAPYALVYLEALLKEHPELAGEIPDLLDQLEDCRRAARLANSSSFKDQAGREKP